MANTLNDETLVAYLQAASRLKFEWGKSDCLMWLADWVLLKRGVDVAARFRGAYSTQKHADMIQANAGGPGALIAACVAGLLDTTNEPLPGDIGVVADGAGAVGAIKVSHGWAKKTARGIRIDGAQHLMAWSMKCRRR